MKEQFDFTMILPDCKHMAVRVYAEVEPWAFCGEVGWDLNFTGAEYCFGEDWAVIDLADLSVRQRKAIVDEAEKVLESVGAH